jgi:hypothetical protein
LLSSLYILLSHLSKGKNTDSGVERGGAERPAAGDLIRGNKAVDLFPRIKSQAAGHSAPLCVCFYPKGTSIGTPVRVLKTYLSASGNEIYSVNPQGGLPIE